MNSAGGFKASNTVTYSSTRTRVPVILIGKSPGIPSPVAQLHLTLSSGMDDLILCIFNYV